MISDLKNPRNLKLTVSASPHMVSDESTAKIMKCVLIALAPSLAVSTYMFGLRAITLTAVCIIACVVLEYVYNLILKKPQTVGDYSAAVTGVLLAFNLPVSLPYWLAIVGCIVAIVVVKQLFGGIGKNLVNPAITARIVLLVSFPVQMTTWAVPKSWMADAVTGPTPLGILSEGGDIATTNWDLFIGNVGGSLGEVSALALLVGFAFLLVKKMVTPIIPACFMLTVILFALLVGQDPIFHLLAGGVVLGACFMATDYVTTPNLLPGQIIFGVGCGIITMTIRLFGQYPEGVSFAILLMNILTPHIDNFCENRMLRRMKK